MSLTSHRVAGKDAPVRTPAQVRVKVWIRVRVWVRVRVRVRFSVHRHDAPIPGSYQRYVRANSK